MSQPMQRIDSHIVTKVVETPWLITEASLHLILEILNHHLMTGDTMEGRCDDFRAQTGGSRNGARAEKSVAILPLYGPIFPRANMMTRKGNATSLEQFRGSLNELIDNPMISSIVLDVDSPGGMSDLLPETVSDIRAGSKIKPIVSVANTAANSAAYYIASAADRMFASPSAQVGSIGVFTVHEDRSKQMENDGVKVTVVSAGPYKAERMPYAALDPEARQYMQEYVDALYDEFVGSVAMSRGTTMEDVLDNYGKGRILNAKNALNVGMIDGIAELGAIVQDMADGGEAVASSAKRPMVGMGSRIRSFTSYDADKEHSEPGTGTGGEPVPRTPPEEGDRGIAGGWRRQTPPIELEQPEERSLMDREQLMALANRLGLSLAEDVTDEQIVEAIQKRADEVVVPMLEVKDQNEKAKSFERDYPEQAEKMARFEQRDRQFEARTFTDRYERFADSSKGFSTLALEKIEDSHLAISNGSFTHDNLAELCDLFAGGDVIVNYAEGGSSRSRHVPFTPPEDADLQSVRKQFSDAVNARMEQDKIDFRSALALVAEEQPELYEMYLTRA